MGHGGQRKLGFSGAKTSKSLKKSRAARAKDRDHELAVRPTDVVISVTHSSIEIRYNVTKFITKSAPPFRGCQSSQKNRKNIVKIPPSTAPSRATSPMSLGPRNVTPRSREQQTVCSRPPTRQKWRSNTSFPAVACNLGTRHRSAPSMSYTQSGWGSTRKGARPLVYHSFASASKFFATHRPSALLVHSSSPFSQERSLRAWMRSLVLRIAIKTSIGSDVSHDFRRAVLS